jgi:hypothetical protein
LYGGFTLLCHHASLAKHLVRSSTIWGSVLVKASFIDPMIISFTATSLSAWNMPSL